MDLGDHGVSQVLGLAHQDEPVVGVVAYHPEDELCRGCTSGITRVSVIASASMSSLTSDLLAPTFGWISDQW